jgi:CDP-diacylglycerol--serine O-phosphatidyltransferase
MPGFFPPVDPERQKKGRRLRRAVPFTKVLPNLITLLALCAGLTAIRMAIEHRFDVAMAAIILAVILDGIDGRLARYFRSDSKFGAELDSLADFVDFGVAPAIFLYVWRLQELFSFGWICAMVLAICTGLRLARFNIALDSAQPRPAWQRDFFVGVPAPAGAATVLLPFYLERVGADIRVAAVAVAIFTLAIALLMVSRLPTLSGKRTGQRIPRERVLPVLVIGVLLMGLFASYPFSCLAIAAIAYLAHLPFAWRARARAELKWQTAAGEPAAPSR